MKLGIIGKAQSGKTTVFNAAAGQHETVGDFSKTVHRALIGVPDERLYVLANLVNPKKITHAQIEFLDVPGIQGKESQSFEVSDDLRQTDTFVMVVNAFAPGADPAAEICALTEEMILLDQVLVETNIDRKARKANLTGDRTNQRDIELLQRCLDVLHKEQPLIDLTLTAEEDKSLRGYQFLSMKPLLLVLNIAEDDLPRAQDIYNAHKSVIEPGKRELAVVCGKVEMELVGLEESDRKDFMKDLGISTPATEQVIQKSYALLGLISYLTAAEPEVRAWTIRRGTSAQKAAGVIHTDIERGFIRAEVIAYDDYVAYQTPAAIKAAGKLRLEGKEYIVADGDVILFRFNV
jgi:GTP-binding protein YchF